MENKRVRAVGFVGPIKSAKTLAARICEKLLGCKYLSLSDEIRNQLLEAGLSIDERENLQNLGDRLREVYGEGVLAERVVEKINNSPFDSFAIDSIRNPGEIRVLREKIPGIVIVGIDASQRTRYQRSLDSGINISWEEFQRLDNREITGIRKPHQIQVDACLGMADKLIKNETNELPLLVEELGLSLTQLAETRKGKERRF